MSQNFIKFTVFYFALINIEKVFEKNMSHWKIVGSCEKTFLSDWKSGGECVTYVSLR